MLDVLYNLYVTTVALEDYIRLEYLYFNIKRKWIIQKNLQWEYFSRLFDMLIDDEDSLERLGIDVDGGRSRK